MIERLKDSTPGRVISRYVAVDAGLWATVIAYQAFFSIFPITLAALFLLGLLFQSQMAYERMAEAIAWIFPADVGSEITYVLQGTRQQVGLLGSISLLGLLWAGSGLFDAMAKAFNRLYGVPDRRMLDQLLLGTGMIFIFGALLLISVVATTTAQWLMQTANLLPNENSGQVAFLGSVLSFLISFGAALTMFVVTYRVVPNTHLSVKNVWPGALLSAFLLLLMLQVFPLYVRYIANFSRFGAIFGFSFLMLTWLYFLAQVLLLGAAYNSVLAAQDRAAR